MVYVDANVFVDAVLYEDKKGEQAKNLLIEIANGKFAAYTSILTWDETVWVVRKFLGKEKAAIEGRKFVEFPNIKFIPVDTIIIIQAQRLMEKYGIRPRDSIHAATAISQGIKEIVSDDQNFDVIKEIRRIPISKFR